MKKIVFFSGGSALASTARELAARLMPATYLVTIFDSGGSTQELRRVFDMPAVGDLRNRLLAAADTRAVTKAALQFLDLRITAPQGEAAQKLSETIRNADWENITEAEEIRADLNFFLEAMPATFTARRASIGNLALTGAWLRLGKNLEAAIERYARLLHAVGTILPVARENLHLGASLGDGTTIIGQHIINKELVLPVERIFLTSRTPWQQGAFKEARPALTQSAREAIETADIICYSMGSFYSSILVNLLARGAGEAIARSRAKKVFIPNTGFDRELQGLNIPGQVRKIIGTLEMDAGSGRFLDIVLLDKANGDYPGGTEIAKNLGPLDITCIDAPIVSGPGVHDPNQLLAALERL